LEKGGLYMKNELIEIYNANITNKFFLDKKSTHLCMEQSYLLGELESEQKYNLLMNAFEELLENYADFGRYNCSREDLLTDWRKLGGLL
jgi:hypothetical protein